MMTHPMTEPTTDTAADMTDLGRRWRAVGAELQRRAPDRWPGIVAGAVDIANRKAPAGAPPIAGDLMAQWIAVARLEVTRPAFFAAMVASTERLEQSGQPFTVAAPVITGAAPDVPPYIAAIAPRLHGVLVALDEIHDELVEVTYPDGDLDLTELTRWLDGIELAVVELGRLLAGPAVAAAEETDALASLASHAPHTYRAIVALANRLTSGAGNDLRFSDHPSPRPMTTERRIG
jgi:hypothetical protein